MTTINKKYGRLKVLSTSIGIPRKVASMSLCECDCGNTINVLTRKLKHGDIRSCGCYFHGGSKTKVARSWNAMKTRCFNPNADNYSRYGGKGIVVCDGFLSFTAFLNSVGNPPTNKHTIDRIDSEGNYSCGKCNQCITNGWKFNCRWATSSEQQKNKSSIRKIVVNGVEMCISDAANILKISRLTLSSRLLRYGWSLEKAISTPALKGNRYKTIKKL
jgi:hypothetical protein